MKRFFCTSVIIILSGFLFGQNNAVEIKGKVLSSKKQIVFNAELFLKVNDSVYKTVTDGKGEYKFTVKKSKAVAELYINSNSKTVSSSVKRNSFLSNHMVYKINMSDKIEYTYDFELKLVNIDYSTPSILFKINSPDVVLDVKYGNASANIDEVIEYFSKLVKQYPKMVLDIEGMISTNEKVNNLSYLRAKYITDLLIAKEVPSANLKPLGRGISLPEIPYNTIKKAKTKAKEEDLQAMNRRVIIKMLKPGEEVEEKEGNHY